jgi:hypothetical protein
MISDTSPEKDTLRYACRDYAAKKRSCRFKFTNDERGEIGYHGFREEGHAACIHICLDLEDDDMLLAGVVVGL